MTTTDTTLVVMLTDHAALTDVTPIAKRGAAPTLYSLSIDSDGHARGMLATLAQLVTHRDLIEQAIDRIRTIERQSRHHAAE